MKILHIQHAAILGGSCVSSLLTVKALRAAGHTVVVALARPTTPLIGFYRREGFDPISWPLACWKHSTVSRFRWWHPIDLGMGTKVLFGWKRAKTRTLQLIDSIQPDVVHLNSMPLVPSASALVDRQVPFVWHVREPPPDQGWRTRKIRATMRKAPALVFISEYDREHWMGKSRGEIIRNFVDFERFHPAVDGRSVRKQLGLNESQPVLLYAGGIAEVKGCFVLLKSLAELKVWFPDVACLMPGTEAAPNPAASVQVARKVLPAIGMQTQTQRFDRLVCNLGLQDIVLRLPFRADMENLIAAADLMLFPAIAPHFARPVIEAAAMAKSSIGSDVGGVNELINDEKTGLLVPGGSSSSLTKAVAWLLNNPADRLKFGQAAYNEALMHYDIDRQICKIVEVIKKVRQASL